MNQFLVIQLALLIIDTADRDTNINTYLEEIQKNKRFVPSELRFVTVERDLF